MLIIEITVLLKIEPRKGLIRNYLHCILIIFQKQKKKISNLLQKICHEFRPLVVEEADLTIVVAHKVEDTLDIEDLELELHFLQDVETNGELHFLQDVETNGLKP